MSKQVVIIGSGIGGLGTACLLAKKGYQVTVLEKNDQVGGRARVFSEQGFRFDMGPSWYMMPDIFEHYFSLLGEDINEYLQLERLAPSYRIFLKSNQQHYDFYSDLDKTREIFESIEPGSGEVLTEYMKTTKYQYNVAKKEFMFKNYDTIFDFFTKRVFEEGRKLPLFSRVESIINKRFKSEILRKVMQYQTVLLGTAPGDAPGIYSLMNYVDFVEGVWYPKGGIRSIIDALEKIALKHGVTIKTNVSVEQIVTKDNEVTGVTVEDGTFLPADIVISNADTVHTDQNLLPKQYRQKSARYWNKRKMAPSAHILYLGVEGKIPSFSHHNLLFSKEWGHNFKQIFKNPAWPDDPSLYICAPSKTDSTVAPPGTENLFVLVPVAAGLDSTDDSLSEYTDFIIDQIEEHMDVPNLKERILYQRVYSVDNFIKDYNAYKGTALGFAHTLSQTAIFRPNNVHKQLNNLFYVGAGTNPGIGMPICLISAELAYKRIEGITHEKPLDSI